MSPRSHLSLVPKAQSPAERWWYGRTNPALLDIGDTAGGLDGEYADEGEADDDMTDAARAGLRELMSSRAPWEPDTDDEHAYIARAAAALGGE